ncbi:ABC transporter permease [Paracoccus saliphilus]|uniref:ABC transporter permease n=1 Tax=Paracoccus saliphilus TaxID=405559 RepID=A0AA45W707_9RHOB|nr:ABC transporter permease [Paracoccus saliphilus]WCR03860.1 ABC transporter permease [Paracoccus saliphilus]SIT05497.1 peptide/nickel transport system permease protein [Paracoccus saliphilus]
MAHMWRLVGRRLLLALAILFVISILIFGALELLPGDAAEALLGQAASPETVAALRRDLGLDQPLVLRYLSWLAGALQGDFGISLASRQPIGELISGRFQNTLFLALYAAAIAVPISLVLGLASAMLRNTIFDRLVNVTALSAISFPDFFVAYILIFLLAQTGMFPTIASGVATADFVGRLHMSFLPAVTLSLAVSAHMLRMTRASIVNLLASPYIEMAHLKGAGPIRLVLIHALPNAASPIINVVAINLAYLVTGVVVVEVVFAYPGMGQLMVDSVSKRDVPVVQAAALIFACAYVLLNLLADVLAILTNPRVLHRR